MSDKKIKYLFLDIDGVLNNPTAMDLANNEEIFSDENFANYQHLYKFLSQKYEVRVVLSSSWRSNPRLLKIIENYREKAADKSCLAIFDKTPDSWRKREEEFEEYLEEKNISYKDIIILDDSFMPDFTQSSVKGIRTSAFDGLRMSEVLEFIHTDFNLVFGHNHVVSEEFIHEMSKRKREWEKYNLWYLIFLISFPTRY